MKHFHITSGITDPSIISGLPNFAGIYFDREDMEQIFEDIYNKIIRNTFEHFESNEEVIPYSRSIKVSGYVLVAFECHSKFCVPTA